jgi:uncharacterized membrane protein (Fun14 family)
MRLFVILILAAILLTAIGVVSVQWNNESMSVEFHKDKAIQATEKVIETGREITGGISRGVGEAEEKADAKEAEKTDSSAK